MLENDVVDVGMQVILNFAVFDFIRFHQLSNIICETEEYSKTIAHPLLFLIQPLSDLRNNSAINRIKFVNNGISLYAVDGHFIQNIHDVAEVRLRKWFDEDEKLVLI